MLFNIFPPFPRHHTSGTLYRGYVYTGGSATLHRGLITALALRASVDTSRAVCHATTRVALSVSAPTGDGTCIAYGKHNATIGNGRPHTPTTCGAGRIFHNSGKMRHRCAGRFHILHA